MKEAFCTSLLWSARFREPSESCDIMDHLPDLLCKCWSLTHAMCNCQACSLLWLCKFSSRSRLLCSVQLHISGHSSKKHNLFQSHLWSDIWRLFQKSLNSLLVSLQSAYMSLISYWNKFRPLLHTISVLYGSSKLIMLIPLINWFNFSLNSIIEHSWLPSSVLCGQKWTLIFHPKPKLP